MITNNNRANIQGVSTIEKKFSKTSTLLPQKLLLAGFQLSDGTNMLYDNVLEITTESEARTQFGAGSELHRMCKAAFRGNQGGLPIYAFPFEDSDANAKKVSTITLSGSATSSGTLSLYVAGFEDEKVEVFVEEFADGGETLATVAVKIKDAINANPDLPWVATSAEAKVTLTARNSGSIKITDIYANVKSEDSRISPPGLSVVTAQDTEGAAISDISKLTDFLNNNSVWYTDLVINSQKASDVKKILEIIGNANMKTGLYNDEDYRPCVLHTSHTGRDINALITNANIPNYSGLITYALPDHIESQVEISSYIAGLLTLKATENVARSYHELKLLELMGPLASSDDFTKSYATRNLLYKKGVTPIQTVGGVCKLGDVVTSWLPEENFDAPFKLLVNLKKTWSMAYDIKILDRSEENLGRPIVASVGATLQSTKAIDTDTVKANVVKLVGEWLKRSLIFDDAYTVENMTVTIDPQNSDRINKIIPVILSGNNRIGNTEIQVSREIHLIAITS